MRMSSRTGLDIGARFFMQHLPENLEGEIVDPVAVMALLA